MIVQGERLAPTAAWEAERLSTYRQGSIVNVIITQTKNRKLKRKYWAILHRVVKDCPVKWRTAEDAHRAIRLSLGVVDPFLTVGGHMHAEVKSTTAMDDPEYQAFFDDAMALLHRITGVDPQTLHLESADVGEDEAESSGHSPDDGSSHTDSTYGNAAADSSASGAAEDRAQARQGAAAPSSDPRYRECIDKFLAVVTDPTVPDRRDRQENLVLAKDSWKGLVPNDFLRTVTNSANLVLKGETDEATAREYLNGVIPAEENP